MNYYEFLENQCEMSITQTVDTVNITLNSTSAWKYLDRFADFWNDPHLESKLDIRECGELGEKRRQETDETSGRLNVLMKIFRRLNKKKPFFDKNINLMQQWIDEYRTKRNSRMLEEALAPIYLHTIYCHLIPALRRFRQLFGFSMSSHEYLNHEVKVVIKMTSAGGGKNENNCC